MQRLSKPSSGSAQFDSEIGMIGFDSRFTAFLRQDACGPVLEMLNYLVATPGKYTRPKVLFELAQVLGVEFNKVMPWALACETLHAASLVHDDIQDGDLMRRGRASIWRKFGPNEAINLGDYLLLRGPQAFLQSTLGDDKKVQLAQRFSVAACSMVAGQSAEFRLNHMADRTKLEEDYQSCIRGKTGALFASLAGGVAIVGGWDAERRAKLESLYEKLGLLLQMQDDVLDLYGDKQRDEVGCDLREGKVSLLIVSALETAPQTFAELKKLLQTPRESTATAEIKRLKKLWSENGSLALAMKKISALSKELVSSPLVNEHQLLGPMLLRMNDVILEPIAHLENIQSKSGSAAIGAFTV